MSRGLGCLIVIAFAFLVVPAGAQDAPARFEVTEGTYLVSLGRALVGEESFRIEPNGWSCRGSYDLFGKKKGRYEISSARDANGLVEWKQSSVESDESRRVEAWLVQEMLTVKRGSGDKEEMLRLREDANPVFFENMVWTCLSDLGELLARRASIGATQPQTVVTAMLPSAATLLVVTIRSAEETRAVFRGQETSLWIFEVDVGARTRIRMLCTPRGLPVRIEAPMQEISAYLEGFESTRWPGVEPSTPVDSGAWRDALSRPEFQVLSGPPVEIPIASGGPVAVEVVRPSAPGRRPAILSIAPEPAVESSRRGADLARRGYAFVAAPAEAARPALEWLASQPWCDGRIGVLGSGAAARAAWTLVERDDDRILAFVSLGPAAADPIDASRIGVPALFVSGWFDEGARGAIRDFTALRSGARNLESRLEPRLLVGPWGPGMAMSRRRDGIDLGAEAIVELQAPVLRFLEHHVKGVDTNLAAEDRAHVFVLGIHRWTRISDWPGHEIDYSRLELAPSGSPAEAACRPLASPVELIGPSEVVVRAPEGFRGQVSVELLREDARGARTSLARGASGPVATREVHVDLGHLAWRLDHGDRIVVRIESPDADLAVQGARLVLPVLARPDAPGLQLARR